MEKLSSQCPALVDSKVPSTSPSDRFDNPPVDESGPCTECDPETVHKLIGALKEARRSSGWSQKTFADRIGTSAQQIKRLEKGVGSITTFVAAMNALDFQLTGLGPGNTLAEQIHNRRLKRKWSILKLSARTGLASGTIRAIENGGGSVASLLTLLDALAPKVKRRAMERSYWGKSKKEDRDSRFTPDDFMQHIYAAFGSIDLDPCAHPLSPVVAKRKIILSEGGDGLKEDWSGRFAFVNPPYSALVVWFRKAHEQWAAGNVDTVVCLVPVRSDSPFFQQTLSKVADINLLAGRIKFLSSAGTAQSTPFSLMLVTLGTTKEQRAKFSTRVEGIWFCRKDTR